MSQEGGVIIHSLKHGKIVGQTLIQPINQWSDFEVWLYIFWRSIEINDLYKCGHAKVGCWPCPCTPPLMDFLRKITHPHLWNRFEEILYKYTKENGRLEKWVKGGFWRLRRPNRKKLLIYPIDITENSSNEILFKYILPFKMTFFEFLKIIGSVEFSGNSFVLKTSHNFKLKRRIIGDKIEVINDTLYVGLAGVVYPACRKRGSVNGALAVVALNLNSRKVIWKFSMTLPGHKNPFISPFTIINHTLYHMNPKGLYVLILIMVHFYGNMKLRMYAGGTHHSYEWCSFC